MKASGRCLFVEILDARLSPRRGKENDKCQTKKAFTIASILFSILIAVWWNRVTLLQLSARAKICLAQIEAVAATKVMLQPPVVKKRYAYSL